MDEETGSRDFREYVAIAQRQKGLIVAVAAVAIAAALIAAIALPAVYRSSATILIQEQEIPPDLVRSTITSFADERIQVISQQVMTRAVLLDLIERYGLYEKYRKREPSDVIVERMRRDINLQTINADVSDRRSGQRVNATIAFRISYDAPKPEQAQRVATDLVNLYLSENIKARQRSVAETTAFLAEEADRLVKQIQDTETKLAEFKRRNADRLPDSAAVNLSLADRTEAELSRTEREISMLQERKLYLESQLVLVKPNLPAASVDPAAPAERTLSPEERLRALEAQYASSAARYGAEHPDMRRMQREIATLRGEARDTPTSSAAARRRGELEAELAAARERYSEDHPDVQRLRKQIAALGATEAREAPRPRAPAADVRTPDNPAYISLQTQLENARRELAHLAGVRDDLRAKRRTYDARLLQVPEVEREYRNLTRDYDNAQNRYREVKAKQMQAEVAQELERDRKAERFALGEPANLPERPVSPDRPKILLIGLLASLGGGLGAGWLRDMLNPAVKGPWDLMRRTGGRIPILTGIPYIETRGESARLRRRRAVLGWIALVLAVLFVLFIHFFLRPLPELAEAVMRRLPF